MRRLLPCLLILACAGCKPKVATEDEKKDLTTEVQAGTFRVAVTATGKVKPNREVQVSSKASGEILTLPFEAGDSAKKGDLLVRLDPIDEQRNVSKADAALEAARAREAKAKSELEVARSTNARTLTEQKAAVSIAQTKLAEMQSKYKRQEQLFKEKMIPEETLETARTAVEQMRTDLERAHAMLKDAENQIHELAAREQDVALAAVEVKNSAIALEEAKKRLSETEVRASMDGVITERKVEPGQVISSVMMNVGGGTLLMVLSDLSRLFVVAVVDEADIGGVRLGQHAIIKADAFPNETFSGKVYHIAPVGVELNSVVSFDVKVEVEGEGLKRLRPGMTADVSITVDEAPDTLWVQSTAVQEGPDGMYVELAGEGADKVKVPVEVGISDGLNTEIKKGIKPGQKIVLTKTQDKGMWSR